MSRTWFGGRDGGQAEDVGLGEGVEEEGWAAGRQEDDAGEGDVGCHWHVPGPERQEEGGRAQPDEARCEGDPEEWGGRALKAGGRYAREMLVLLL